ncbi:UDP-glucose/GDP-mannose dehydrogenase family protein [Neobacillus notoginsengisoli]|uniref:UDP-glucose 6-dehydrogenase n=1 Tax=Neobacillus notoginsengisoli TaxID=1578198 RepID=A0A417Z088_9BACI|nr:UDP-glucose/GDP-mannose dehydrogenase family protein [Neobacillus notoginsengisoli]RHW43569.1 UDP-glucose/GDP-mannose dehydrogenase family protein [Neobacillus notoginsengisoli]
MNILVIGTGYVGTTTGLIFCEMGYRVTGLDVDTRKIKALKEGKLHFFEPGMEELLMKHHQAGNISFTKETEKAIKENDIIFICVGTPMGEDGKADLIYVKNVSEEIGRYMDDYKVIVTKSTVPVGTAEKVAKWIESSQKKPISLDVVSNPEFLREGSALKDALTPDRIVIGTSSEQSRKIMRELYKNFHCPVVETTPKVSEMIKYAANSFLALKISYINELSRLCDVLGINVKDISKGIGLDHRIGAHFLQAGLGYGGSCFPKDVNAFIQTAKQHGRSLSILESAVKVNEEQPVFFLDKIKQALGGTVENKTLAILGLSFKANTDDTRESPSLLLINKLLEEKAIVKTHDPVAKTDLVPQYPSVLEAVEGADAIILCTDWKEYKEMELSALKAVMKQPYLFDGRNMLDKKLVDSLGFHYVGIAI